jgi:RimJ/RimL family protein N-acetyltransferase
LVGVDWGFATLNVPYLTAMIQHANQRSIHVAERLGFESMREDVLEGDRVIVFALARAAAERLAEERA